MSFEQLEGRVVLVTGGAGFIGSHLADELLRLRARVRVLDNYSTGNRRNLEDAAQKAEIVEADIRDLEACRQCCESRFHTPTGQYACWDNTYNICRYPTDCGQPYPLP